MPFTTYILNCKDNTLYTGATNNLVKRLKEHNQSKKGARYTRIRRPVNLVYSEEYQTLKEARSREHAIKQLTRDEKLALISQN